jgi:hypothetical protein
LFGDDVDLLFLSAFSQLLHDSGDEPSLSQKYTSDSEARATEVTTAIAVPFSLLSLYFFYFLNIYLFISLRRKRAGQYSLFQAAIEAQKSTWAEALQAQVAQADDALKELRVQSETVRSRALL